MRGQSGRHGRRGQGSASTNRPDRYGLCASMKAPQSKKASHCLKLPKVTPPSLPGFDRRARACGSGLGLPINDLFRYALLLLATIPIFVGTISRRPEPWIAAISIVVLTIATQWLSLAPRIEEGHNVFIAASRRQCASAGLTGGCVPPNVRRVQASYPSERRCDPQAFGCCAPRRFPRAPMHSPPIASTAARPIRGTLPESISPTRYGYASGSLMRRYNWGGASDLQRGKREPWWDILHPWRLTMPHFVMYVFPAEFVGSRLCWRGLVFGKRQTSALPRRATPNSHAGRSRAAILDGRIFGVSIGSPLAMTLDPTMAVQLRQLVQPGLALLAVVCGADVASAMATTTIGAAVYTYRIFATGRAVHDASFIGGVRPFDGGDDGLVYEGMARQIVQHALNGEFARALEGGEKVFFYGGPGLRYLRAVGTFYVRRYVPRLSLADPAVAIHGVRVFRRFLDARTGSRVDADLHCNSNRRAVRNDVLPICQMGGARLCRSGGSDIISRRLCRSPRSNRRRARGNASRPPSVRGCCSHSRSGVRPNLAPGAAVLLGGAGLAALWQVAFRPFCRSVYRLSAGVRHGAAQLDTSAACSCCSAPTSWNRRTFQCRHRPMSLRSAISCGWISPAATSCVCCRKLPDCLLVLRNLR